MATQGQPTDRPAPSGGTGAPARIRMEVTITRAATGAVEKHVLYGHPDRPMTESELRAAIEGAQPEGV